MKDTQGPTRGQFPTTDHPPSNGKSHFSHDGDTIAETKAGKVIFVTVPRARLRGDEKGSH